MKGYEGRFVLRVCSFTFPSLVHGRVSHVPFVALRTKLQWFLTRPEAI